MAKTDRGLFRLKHSNSQDYHGYTWHQLTQKDIKQEEQAKSNEKQTENPEQVAPNGKKLLEINSLNQKKILIIIKNT